MIYSFGRDSYGTINGFELLINLMFDDLCFVLNIVLSY